MDKKWQGIAKRIVAGLGVQSGELIDVRDGSGCFDLLLEVSLAIERVGGTLWLQLLQSDYLERPTGWTIVDEHIHGYLFIALGENWYMGG